MPPGGRNVIAYVSGCVHTPMLVHAQNKHNAKGHLLIQQNAGREATEWGGGEEICFEKVKVVTTLTELAGKYQ